MQRITNDLDGSTDSDVAGDMSENVDRDLEVLTKDKNNIDNDDDFWKWYGVF